MNPTQSKPITILLDNNAHRYAQQFAKEQSNPIKGKQVYLNTLTVYSIHTYLKSLNINSNIANSDCWLTGLRAMFNVADITLSNGKLECLWLLPGEETTTIPLEIREDRLGYIVVQLEAELKQIELLGFISGDNIKFDTETINISRLQPLETLFYVIATPKKTPLNQWLNNIFTSDWQPVETILAGRITRSLTTANSTTAITRGKTIARQINSLEQEIILVIKMMPQSDKTVDLCLQLYPGEGNNNLHAGLSVSILDAANQTCMSAQAKDTDDWMQLEFSCQPKEEFKVEMNLEGVSIVEQFLA
ncbi:MAG: DUF1822 family protein [Pleurocapsa sp.]